MTEPSEGEIRSVVLPVGADLYAVPIDWVREVVAAPALTRLVTAPPLVLGLMNLRGEIVPVFDTAVLLGVGSIGTAEFAAVVQTPNGHAALASTGLPSRASLGSLSEPSELPGTSGIYQVERGVVVLLDPGVLLATDRVDAIGPEAVPRPVLVA